jgi:hypothetical protein
MEFTLVFKAKISIVEFTEPSKKSLLSTTLPTFAASTSPISKIHILQLTILKKLPQPTSALNIGPVNLKLTLTELF